MKKQLKQLKYLMVLLLIGANACIDNPITDDETKISPTPELGQSSFESADPMASSESLNRGADGQNNDEKTVDDQAYAGNSKRKAEEGDIYRVAESDGLIFNLNAYRGLQIIDFSDPSSPEIIGRAKIAGTPVEMYQVGTQVFILMNNWYGYYGTRSTVSSQQYHGGVVAVVDISDTSNPVITSRTQVPGFIRTSRLTRGGGKESLYVVANDWSTNKTYVKSFSVANQAIAEKSLIDLEGHIQDIQATGTRLLVSRWNGRQQERGSEIAIIDISDPNGSMVEGTSVRVKGRVSKKSDMNLQGDILRIVSGNSWASETNTNHVETFNATDIMNITPIDHKTFGANQNLFATIFLENSAFFVTYERQDPFHAFSITDAGMLNEEAEFIVSGFNNWFKPVADNTRLIGIGINDENGTNSPAVSLYNIEDLKNVNPLLDRDELPLKWSWSEANWDDRAFSVLEKTVNVEVSPGKFETGLVLLPFSGWDGSSYRSGVQIFTFSDSTVTKRGVMVHDTQVRRTFVANRAQKLSGNMSEEELSLYNMSDVDAPTEVSRLELAPDYSNYLVFGSHAARRQNRSNYWDWWGNNSNILKTDLVQIVDRNLDPDVAPAMAEISIPANAQLFKKGNLLLVVSVDYTSTANHKKSVRETLITIWDLSSPTAPVMKDTLSTTALPEGYGGCWDCEINYSYYRGYGSSINAKIVGDALVFPESTPQKELLGTLHSTSKYSRDRHGCQGDGDRTNNQTSSNDENMKPSKPAQCTFIRGYEQCSYLVTASGTVGPTTCEGNFESCTVDSNGARDCQTISTPSNAEVNTRSRELYRRWSQQKYHVVDFSNPAQLALRNTIEMGVNEEAQDTLVEGNQLYFSYKVPTRSISGKFFAKHYFKKLDFTNPSTVAMSSPVNTPGVLVAVEGSTLFTRDYLWGAFGIENSVNRLEFVNGVAYLRGVKRFADKSINNFMLDGAGQILVTFNTPYYVNQRVHGEDYNAYDQGTKLAILKTTGAFKIESEFNLEAWASLKSAVSGRAIFNVPGGVLILNTSNAAQPYAQAFFPMNGWSKEYERVGSDIFVAAGRYGMYKFDLNAFNLLQP